MVMALIITRFACINCNTLSSYMPDLFKHYSTFEGLTSKPAMCTTRCLSTKYMDP